MLISLAQVLVIVEKKPTHKIAWPISFCLISLLVACGTSMPATPTPTPAPSVVQANFIMELIKTNPSGFAESYSLKKVELRSPSVIAVQAREGAKTWTILLAVDREQTDTEVVYSGNIYQPNRTIVTATIRQVRAEVSADTAAIVAEGLEWSIECVFRDGISYENEEEESGDYMVYRTRYERVYCIED